MNKKNHEIYGFEKKIKLVEEKKCPTCKKDIKETDFRDELSKREHKISGMCQECQDLVFGK
jgi:hypothetical protein